MLSTGVYPCRYQRGGQRTGHSTSTSRAISAIGDHLQCFYLTCYSEQYVVYKLLGRTKKICKKYVSDTLKASNSGV